MTNRPLIATHLLDVFTDQQLESVEKILSFLPDSESGEIFHGYTNGFTEKDIVYKLVLNKLLQPVIEQALGQKIHVACGMHLKELVPWKVHTDYIHPFDNGRIPDIAILIPLKTQPSDQLTHTVVFNQISYDGNYDKTPIDSNAKNIYNEHCSHHATDEDLACLSVRGIYPWLPRSLICWDRALIHCSDNFLKNNIIEKQALVLFAVKEQNG
jgi:hypothetical protein